MLLERLSLRGILSFKDLSLELGNLNVLIGPNGSGKSNLIEAVNLFRMLPSDAEAAFRQAGGSTDLRWKGRESDILSLRAQVNPLTGGHFYLDVNPTWLFDGLSLSETLAGTGKEPSPPFWFVRRQGAKATLLARSQHNGQTASLEVNRDELDPSKSIFSQVVDAVQYPEITFTGWSLSRIRVFRDWTVGSKIAVRYPQPADMEDEFLREDTANLGLVLNRMERIGGRDQIDEYLTRLLPNYKKLSIQVQANTVQLFLAEGNLNSPIPATRLSDGTLSFLRLMSILCHPQPPPLICIEEPEIGLHPDALSLVAEALKSAATRTQLIVTTHSEALVDAFSDQPESVIVCERGSDGASHMNRVRPDDLTAWLEDYRLGEIWRRGEVGGNIW